MKDHLRFFLSWLDTASEQEILDKKQALTVKLEQVTDPDLRRFIRLCLRLADEELLARAEVLRLKQS